MPSESTIRDGSEARNLAEPDYQLIETMRWEPLSGILRFDLHMARLENSAQTLGFHYDMETVHQKIAETATGESPLRLRLTLAPDGSVTLAAQPYEPLPDNTLWRIAVAKTRLNQNDPLLRHKTTRRQTYIAAREEYSSAEVDEVILLNEHDEICEGTITSVFLDMGGTSCVTPALSCGLLDGVLRRELLNNNVAQEGVVSMDDLSHARNILVGNSLRGMIRAQLVTI
ncbi:aminotransferase class IV family protein [Brucella gallinifaecis]|uniref:Probable branched-chain-amino-acid aminotransferase n=1 Tax=Brucella gallinifaecis TaxID=215590 RepID=A0A502BSF7_9HYPH|nr:aminotransferase class IV family protein [Brucella gallinifaecis]TPF77155.1 hypothetical protein FHY56_02030 [Brucella gallinifaecis]